MIGCMRWSMGDCAPEGAYGLYGRRGMYGFAVWNSCFFSSGEKCSIVTLLEEVKLRRHILRKSLIVSRNQWKSVSM